MAQFLEQLDQVANNLQEEIRTDAGQVKSEADYLHLDREFASQIQSLYDLSREHGYMAKIVEVAPKKAKGHIVYMLRQEQKQLKDLLGLMKKYGHKFSELKRTEGKISYWQSRDAIQFSGKRGEHEYKELVNRYKELKGEVQEYGVKIKQSAGNFNKFKNTFSREIDHYARKREASSKAGGAIALAMVAVFGVAVIYALSRLSPENISTGAFVFESASPIPLAMLSGTVIFLLFFLTHHKLR